MRVNARQSDQALTRAVRTRLKLQRARETRPIVQTTSPSLPGHSNYDHRLVIESAKVKVTDKSARQAVGLKIEIHEIHQNFPLQQNPFL